jgi:gluconolactonase
MKRAATFALAAVFLYAQDFSEIRIEHLAKGLGFAEGPAWSHEGYLIYSDTPADRLYKWVPGQQPAIFREDAHGPSGNAFDTDGRLYTCETRTRRVTRTDKKGAVEVLAERWEGKRLNAPNDIAVVRNGHAYFTDPAFGSQQDHRELDFYGVYHLPPKGPLKLVAKPTGRPNGIAVAPNGRTLYVVNSDERNVRAYDVDRAGETSNERILVARVEGVPGGIRTDEKGNLYVTGKGIAVYSAEGKLLHRIELKGQAANCGFGEADGKTLFIAAGPEMLRARLDVKGAN